MPKLFRISSTIEEYIEAENEDEALEKFWEIIEGAPQQTIATYLSDNLSIDKVRYN